MVETPAYFTKLMEEQLALLAEKIPEGEEVVISQGKIKLRKNGREQDLELTSPSEIEEYLVEFRRPILEGELPTIEGDETEQTKKILTKLRSNRHKKTFEYYYLLGKLLKDYPTIVKAEVILEYGQRQSWIILNLLQKTATLFDAVGISYLKIKKLSPSKLRRMTQKTFDKLMTEVNSIVAARRVASSLVLEDLLREYNVPVSQELNTDAGVMLPGFEFDPNSLIDDPEIP